MHNWLLGIMEAKSGNCKKAIKGARGERRLRTAAVESNPSLHWRYICILCVEYVVCSACFAFLCYCVNLLHDFMTSTGRFGVGVKAYFVFLRYLLCLNFLNFITISVFVLSHTQYKERRSMNCKHVKMQRILGSVCWFCLSANIILVFF